MELPKLCIFISSPGDVAEERVLTARVIRRLEGQFSNRVILEPIFWEHEPLLATETFQTQIIRPSETDIVICILWSRLGTRLPSQLTRPDGSRYGSGTEYEFEEAVEGKRRKGSPDLLVYRKMAEPLVSLKDKQALLESLNQKEALDLFVNKWFHDPEEGTLIAAFHQFESSAQYEEVLEEHLRRLIERRLPKGEAGEVVTVPPSWTKGSPFRGLEVFDFEHAPIFFGRTKAVGDVLNALRAQAAHGRAFVLVLGMSGGGKSSLIRAGVLPLLTQPGVIQGVGLWRRSILRPSDVSGDLFNGLATALVREEALPELTTAGTSTREMAQLLREAPKTAFFLIKGALSQAAAHFAAKEKLAQQPDARLLLVIDQMEELLTLERISPDERRGFIEALSAFARSGKAWVIATLRSDFYPRLAELPELVSLKEGAGQYDLLSPTPAEIGQMIRQPALAAGLRFEEEPETKARLDDVLRDAASKSPESLPLLEFALEELYQQRSSNGVLTHEAYKQIGGVEGALAQRAEEVFTSLSPDVQAVLPDIFRALVSVGVGEEETLIRKQAPIASVTATSQTKTFVEAFVNARLFTTGLSDDGSAVVTIAHEALLRNWPRLKSWLEEDKEFLRVRARVAAAAARWREEGKRPDLLLSEGKPLAEAESLFKARGIDVGENEKTFIKTSITRARRRRRIKRLAIAALVVLTILAGGGAWLSTKLLAEGLVAQGDALGLANRWAEARERYHKARNIFRWISTSPLLADLGLWDAYRNSPTPLSSFTGHTRGLFEGVKRVVFSPDGVQALSGDWEGTVKLWDIKTGREMRTLTGHNGSVISVAFDPVGAFAVSVGNDTSVIFWDLETGRKRVFAKTGWVRSVALTFDCCLALLAGDSETLILWDAATGREIRKFTGPTGPVISVAISRDDRLALSGGADGSVKLWDVKTGREIRTLTGYEHKGRVFHVAFSDKYSRKALSASSDAVVLWDVQTGRWLSAHSKPYITSAAATLHPNGGLVLDGHVGYGNLESWPVDAAGVPTAPTFTWQTDPTWDGHVNNIAVSPDGESVLSAGSDGNLKLWSVRDLRRSGLHWEERYGREVSTWPALYAHEGSVNSVAFSSDGRLALSGGADRTVRLWDVETGQRLRSSVRHATEVISVAFSPDGRLALTGSADSTLKLWDLETAGEVRTFTTRTTSKLTNVGFSPDGRLVIGKFEAGLTGEIELKHWKVETGNEVSSSINTTRDTESIADSPNGGLVLAADTDGSLLLYRKRWKLWDLESWKAWWKSKWKEKSLLPLGDEELRRFKGHTSQIASVAFSPDGKLALSGDKDGNLKLWDFSRVEQYREFEAKLAEARNKLQRNPEDAEALKAFGDWYYFRGRWDWAVEFLERARTNGAKNVSSLSLARSYWQSGNIEAARREFQRALQQKEAPELYIELCLQATLRPAGVR